MSWIDRLKDAAYTSPAGDRFAFVYEDVRLTHEKKGGVFEYPNGDGTFVQELGNTSRRYPMRVIFTGGNHDLTADRFDDAIREFGSGVLDHPMYGRKEVVPFGQFTRRDDLVTAANQTIFELTFWETAAAGLTFGPSIEDIIRDKLEKYVDALQDQFPTLTAISTASDTAAFVNSYVALANETVEGLSSVISSSEDGGRESLAIFDSLILNIDNLVTDTATLAAQTTRLLGSFGGSTLDTASALASFGSSSTAAINTIPTDANVFLGSDLTVSGLVLSSVLVASEAEYTTRPQAIEAAATVQEQFDAVVAWRDGYFEQFGLVDTGEAHQQLQDAVTATVGFLVQTSFELQQERTIYTTKAATPINLTAQLYGDLDQLDFFIESNGLIGEEFFEIPAGRRVVYYA